jgi:septal ring factor EnvC (AmiA/AmiB activator)
MQGSRASVELAMAGRDPNESGRQATYLGYLYRARTTRIGQLARDTEQLRTVLRETADEAGALAELEAEQSRERATLIAERTRREAALTRLSSEIARQRQQLESLKRDEERLSRLVRKLEQEAAARARAARARSKTGKSARQEKAVPAGLPREAEATRFAKLKGRLHLPLRGELANRFGSPRSDTGLSWNGVFIRASKGTRVRAVADGRIVFADGLRGYGNMLIVDHGEGFMSLYGNNESLLHKPGESVSAGQVVAATGTSSGNPESGLYFEMRFRGKPIDPAVWIELK